MELEPEQYAIYKEDFNGIDIDGNGALDNGEINKLLEQQLGKPIDAGYNSEAATMFASMERNSAGRVSLDAYLVGLLGAGWRVRETGTSMKTAAIAAMFLSTLSANAEKTQREREALASKVAEAEASKSGWHSIRGRMAVAAAFNAGSVAAEVGQEAEETASIHTELEESKAKLAATAPYKAKFQQATTKFKALGTAIAFLNVLQKAKPDLAKIEQLEQEAKAEADAERQKLAASSAAPLAAKKARASWFRAKGKLALITNSSNLQDHKADAETVEAQAAEQVKTAEAAEQEQSRAKAGLAGAMSKIRALQAIKGGLQEAEEDEADEQSVVSADTKLTIALSAALFRAKALQSRAEEEASEVESQAAKADVTEAKMHETAGKSLFLRRTHTMLQPAVTGDEEEDAKAEDEYEEAEGEAVELEGAAKAAKSAKARWVTGRNALSAISAFQAAANPVAAADAARAEAKREEAEALQQLKDEAIVDEEVSAARTSLMAIKGAISFVSKVLHALNSVAIIADPSLYASHS
jgi:hypothetical protein